MPVPLKACTLGVNTVLADGNGTTAYNLSIPANALNNNVNPPIFKIQAVPAGDQGQDTCGTYSIDNFGQQLPANNNCW